MSTSCQHFDWKAYSLGELDSASRREAELHAATCQNCREEAATLRVTLDAMAALREEEMPRRIAFVSDKVFEPRWYQKLWSPNFAAACVVAVAILAHGFARPAASVDQAQIDAAVTKAVAEVEVKHQEQLAAVASAYDVLTKQFRQVYKQSVSFVRQ
jgi:anti-sigma factor RsiW